MSIELVETLDRRRFPSLEFVRFECFRSDREVLSRTNRCGRRGRRRLVVLRRQSRPTGDRRETPIRRSTPLPTRSFSSPSILVSFVFSGIRIDQSVERQSADHRHRSSGLVQIDVDPSGRTNDQQTIPSSSSLFFFSLSKGTSSLQITSKSDDEQQLIIVKRIYPNAFDEDEVRDAKTNLCVDDLSSFYSFSAKKRR